jgi:hypothetical protein
MEKPITRSLLAMFIKYAATQRVTPLEWNRFAVNHYRDERMEGKRGEVPKADMDRLYSIAASLRASEGTDHS